VFDIGFLELFLIAIVGLFVIGPERLPGAIKTVAIWFSRIKRNLTETKKELERHIGADEIRREIYNEQVMHNLEKLKQTRDELESKITDWADDPNAEGNPSGDNLALESDSSGQTNYDSDYDDGSNHDGNYDESSYDESSYDNGNHDDHEEYHEEYQEEYHEDSHTVSMEPDDNSVSNYEDSVESNSNDTSEQPTEHPKT